MPLLSLLSRYFTGYPANSWDGHRPSQMGPPTLYLCCNCGAGPQSIKINPACYNCNHHGCGNCSAADASETGAFDTALLRAPDNTDLQLSDTSGDGHLYAGSPTTARFTACHRSQNEYHTQDLDPDERIPAYDAVRTMPPLGSLEKDVRTHGGSAWYCCNCKDVPQGEFNNTCCPMCGQPRCAVCNMEPLK